MLQLAKGNRAAWSLLCSKPEPFATSAVIIVHLQRGFEHRAALQSFLNCNCGWRMPELADQLGNSRSCQQDQKPNLSERCDIISFEFQVLGAQDFHFSVAALHLFATPPTLFLRQQIKSSTKKHSGKNEGLAAAAQIPDFVTTIGFGAIPIIKVAFVWTVPFFGFPRLFQTKPCLADRRGLTTADLVPGGNCNPKDLSRDEAEIPFVFTHQAESNFQIAAQKRLLREIRETGKAEEDGGWESSCCLGGNIAPRKSVCKYIFQHFTVQQKLQAELPQEILLQ